MLTIYGNIYLYFSKPLTIEFRHQKKTVYERVLYFKSGKYACVMDVTKKDLIFWESTYFV